ncbi:hypothetical protein [Streptomyces harbinensis]|uniref:hypothetical protein n=1 Tax=Streptomyces harbinensis TaxID=1176198 RepID=UPI0036900E39
MTQPPHSPARPGLPPPGPPPPALPPASLPAPPAVPPVPPPAPPVPPRPPGRPRLSDWAKGVRSLRAAARTEPGRLRIIGAAVVAALLLFGAATAWQIADRAEAADTLIDSSQPLSAEAADIYRSLADANTSAAVALLTGTGSDPQVRERYEERVATAAALLTRAAAHTGSSPRAQELIAELNAELPVYTGLVETARANDRLGLPLGGAYLRYADSRMQEVLLPAAASLYALETERFQHDARRAADWPWFSLAAAGLALAVLAWVQRRHWLRTHRVFNQGLLAATGAALVLLLWLTGSHTLARAALHDADRGGAQSLSALNDAWIAALQARGAEGMTLVARGSGTGFEESYQERMTELAGLPAGNGENGSADGDAVDTPQGRLGTAWQLADDKAGRAPVEAAHAAVGEWRGLHEEARQRENAGEYQEAVELVIGEGSTGEAFDRVDEALAQALAHEQDQFTRAAERAVTARTGLLVGALALAVLAAGCAVLGINQRLAEYG